MAKLSDATQRRTKSFAFNMGDRNKGIGLQLIALHALLSRKTIFCVKYMGYINLYVHYKMYFQSGLHNLECPPFQVFRHVGMALLFVKFH